MAYRPHGALARLVYEKIHNDRHLEEYDMNLWYSLTDLLPEKYQPHFILLNQPDEVTLQWMENSKILSSSFWLQLWHLIVRMCLMTFMTQTDINGLLKRGSMFILSEFQFVQLLKAGGFNPSLFDNSKMIDMIDIGAGDGEVTSRLAKAVIHMGSDLLLKVYTTEHSWTMRERLQKKNFIVVENLSDVRNIHLVSCLNVLDRCVDPYKIMENIHNILAPNGRAIVALVLPYSHYVESNSSHIPLRPLLPHCPKNTCLSFAEEAGLFFEQLESMGFCIEAWTKAPYLCEGDLRQSFYWLIDVVVVLSKK